MPTSSLRTVSVIGLGRVGLPLALSFADRGISVLGVDRDPDVLASVRAGRMPFHETDFQEVLERVLPTGRLELAERAVDAARSDDIVITVGTPSFSHIESDLRQVRAAVDDLLPLLRPGHALILRSTIAPSRPARSPTSTTSPTESSPRWPRRRARTRTSTSRPRRSRRWRSWRS